MESIKVVDGIPTCKIGHKMVISSFAEKGYQSGFICNICNETYSTPQRWFCDVCYTTSNGERDQYGEKYSGEDICLKCVLDDEVKKLENSYESDDHDSNSANHDNDNSHLKADLDNSDTSSVRPESRHPNSDNDSSPEPRSCCCLS